MIRIWGLALLVVGAWLATIYGQYRPQPLGLDAPAVQFSAARADAALGRLLGDQRPHPAGSAEAAAFRARLLKELDQLGVHARTVTQMSCFSEKRWNNLPCGTVTNIIAEVTPGRAPDIVLMAHTDSVAAGPGAADDASGVATVLETIRALKARSGARRVRPIVALFTDGEETALLGAAAYLREPGMRMRTGAVINVEARGNQGPSFLFQTSSGNAPLIDIYAQAVPHLASSSLDAEIYKYLPNDTDLTPMLGAGLIGLNFAFIGDVAQYHTPLDRRENIDPASLQQHGENMLEMADALSQTDLSAVRGENAVYLDVLGRVLPRMPESFALPLAVAALLLILLAGRLSRRQGLGQGPNPVLALAMPGLLLAGAIGAGFGLTYTAARISGHADPSFAHPLYLRVALAFGVWFVALLVSRWSGAVASWAWLAAPAVAAALLAPGLSPYFLFPSLIAAPLLLITAWGGRGPALFIAALPALVIWIGLAAASEAIMGLSLHMLFTATVAIGLIALLPLLGTASRPAWIGSMLVSLVAAIGMAVLAGRQPAFSESAPQRLNLRYVEQDGRAYWQADPVAQLPPALRAAAAFGNRPQRLLDWGYVAPAGPARLAPPSALASRKGDDVTLDLNAPGPGVIVEVPAQAKLRSLTIGGLTTPAPEGRVSIVCGTPDCGSTRMVLHLGSPGPAELVLASWRYGLPPEGEKLLKARPLEAMPSGRGDETLLTAKIAVPGR
ncbi:MAG TPA: M20/M25/M40 family metallo-hydrolase [Rhizomicrobium sp.]|nr:M20/M25/M40 family metallo-hydrolase [Rhizomicrobium sp.]